VTAQTAFSLDEIDAALAAAGPRPDQDEQRLAAAVLRMLSAGQPVGVSAAAAAAEIPAPQAAAALQSWPAVFWDEHDQITGFWGLALTGMPHRLRRAGTGLGAWCAWDPLFLARVIGDLEVATADPVTGTAITYRISGDGTITGASHTDSVLSFLRPGQPWDAPGTRRRWPIAATWPTGPARPAMRKGPRTDPLHCRQSLSESWTLITYLVFTWSRSRTR